MSKTVVKPQRENMPSRAPDTALASFACGWEKIGAIKWTWLFHRPAVTTRPCPSITWADLPGCTLAEGPTALILPSRMTSVASVIGATLGAG